MNAFDYFSSLPVGAVVFGARIVFKADSAVWVEAAGETRIVRQ